MPTKVIQLKVVRSKRSRYKSGKNKTTLLLPRLCVFVEVGANKGIQCLDPAWKPQRNLLTPHHQPLLLTCLHPSGAHQLQEGPVILRHPTIWT